MPREDDWRAKLDALGESTFRGRFLQQFAALFYKNGAYAALESHCARMVAHMGGFPCARASWSSMALARLRGATARLLPRAAHVPSARCAELLNWAPGL